MADNPATESEAVTDEQSARNFVSQLMSEEPEGPTDDDRPDQPDREAQAETEETPDEAEASDEEPEDASSEEGEADPDESVELPETLEGFAEELGVDPEELANHLKVTVTVNGQKKEVTLAEARTGHQLDADYRQKTMELAEQRKALEAERQQAQERWQQRVQQLDDHIAVAEKLYGSGPDEEQMNRLLQEDAEEYIRQKAQWDRWKERIDSLKSEREKVGTEQREEAVRKHTEYRQEQQRLLSENMPEVRDPEKLRAFEHDATEALKSYGYSDEEIGQFFTLYDYRTVLILRDALSHRRMEDGKGKLSKKLKAKPRVQKPGTAQGKKTPEDKLVASRDRLRRLGRKGTRKQQESAAFEYLKDIV